LEVSMMRVLAIVVALCLILAEDCLPLWRDSL